MPVVSSSAAERIDQLAGWRAPGKAKGKGKKKVAASRPYLTKPQLNY